MCINRARNLILFLLFFMLSIFYSNFLYSAGIGYVVKVYGRAILEDTKKSLLKGDSISNYANIFVYPESLIVVKLYQGSELKIIGYTKLHIQVFLATENVYIELDYGNMIFKTRKDKVIYLKTLTSYALMTKGVFGILSSQDIDIFAVFSGFAQFGDPKKGIFYLLFPFEESRMRRGGIPAKPLFLNPEITPTEWIFSYDIESKKLNLINPKIYYIPRKNESSSFIDSIFRRDE